ncbi:hypothetical protein PUN28_003371 [Cardiocondyla obscurior]|uniref:Ribosomal protein L2 n=1 Tax=Cardiocondyla obscurior TaxID=286306 RepID=A0AAW2GMF2_9HYME
MGDKNRPLLGDFSKIKKKKGLIRFKLPQFTSMNDETVPFSQSPANGRCRKGPREGSGWKFTQGRKTGRVQFQSPDAMHSTSSRSDARDHRVGVRYSFLTKLTSRVYSRTLIRVYEIRVMLLNRREWPLILMDASNGSTSIDSHNTPVPLMHILDHQPWTTGAFFSGTRKESNFS